MKATVSVDVEPNHARMMLRIAGFNIDEKNDKEVCEMAIRMNDSYGVKTESIVWDEGMEEA